MLVAAALLVVAVAAVALWWGTWAVVVVAAAVAIVEYLALQRTERFSTRLGRIAPSRRRRRREQWLDVVYAVTAVAGVALFLGGLLSLLAG
jgi:hypothetical protein